MDVKISCCSWLSVWNELEDHTTPSLQDFYFLRYDSVRLPRQSPPTLRGCASVSGGGEVGPTRTSAVDRRANCGVASSTNYGRDRCCAGQSGNGLVPPNSMPISPNTIVKITKDDCCGEKTSWNTTKAIKPCSPEKGAAASQMAATNFWEVRSLDYGELQEKQMERSTQTPKFESLTPLDS